MDRCDYVSGFHTGARLHARARGASRHRVDAEGRLPARAHVSELVRITSHHTWFTAAGFDTGALTPFLYAFIDREKILDFFETVTGGRMMFNYFRPGGVKDDIQPEAAADMIALPQELRPPGRRLRVAAHRQRDLPRPHARHRLPDPRGHRGVRRDRPDGARVRLRHRPSPRRALRGLRPTSAVNVAARRGGRHLRPLRRAHRRDARVGAASRSRRSRGMPEGRTSPSGRAAHRSSPPAGTAYREVESPRGELGVFVVSDGTAQAVAAQGPLPRLLQPPRRARAARRDCESVTSSRSSGSVDVVMGEIDR